jgi:hypothetical protein
MNTKKLRWTLIAGMWVYAAVTFCQSAFPGAQGFGASATGGRGGKVIYVTNLNVSGPGSLQDALNQDGPRYILFKVSGVIQGTIKVPDGKGNFTLAGQTSPSGITVRGFEMYNDENPSVSNVIIRHLRSRIGDRIKFPASHWLAEDGITIGGVHKAVIDHCSFEHASDEAVDISRSSQITIQHCILGETLGSHADLGGMLINYSSPQSRLDSLSIIYNVWNRIGGRMPEISCETAFCNGKTIHLELSNNVFWDPQIELWYEGITGFNGNFFLKMNAVSNLYFARPQYGNGMFHFDLLNFPQNQLHFAGNRLNLYYPQYSDYQLFYCCNDFAMNHPNTNFGVAQKSNTRFSFPPVTYHPVEQLPQLIGDNAGAFPRDAMDRRLISYIKNNQIPALPVSSAAADDAFVLDVAGPFPPDSDNDGMPDYWEELQGLNTVVQDHNGVSLSLRITGEAGYTNLECYLNCLSDALVRGFTTPECGIQLNPVNTENSMNSHEIHVFPNPARGIVQIELSGISHYGKVLQIYDPLGTKMLESMIENQNIQTDLTSFLPGIYLVKILDSGSGRALFHRKIALIP